MAVTSDFSDHCVELLSSLGPVRAMRMFGGRGYYVDEVFIALAQDDRLYLKTDETTRPTFEAAGCEPFVYEVRGERTSLSYWTAPDDAMESPALMRPWARLAMEAGLRKRNAKPAPRKKTAVKKTAAKKATVGKAPAQAAAPKKAASKGGPAKTGTARASAKSTTARKAAAGKAATSKALKPSSATPSKRAAKKAPRTPAAARPKR